MSGDEVLDAVRAFFAAEGGAGLVLPTGWFGRPHDNVHVLTGARRDGDAVVVELDGRLTLAFEGPVAAVRDGAALRLGGWTRVRWHRLGYGSGAAHQEEFREGTVEFVAG